MCACVLRGNRTYGSGRAFAVLPCVEAWRICIIAEEQIVLRQYLGCPPGLCVQLLKFERRAQGAPQRLAYGGALCLLL